MCTSYKKILTHNRSSESITLSTGYQLGSGQQHTPSFLVTAAAHIIVDNPMSDLCWTSQQNNTIILNVVNKPVSETS